MSRKLVSKDLLGHKKRVNSLSWSSDGNLLASGSSDCTIRLWKANDLSSPSVKELEGHQNSVNQVSFHPKNPKILASGSSDNSVRLWRIVNAKQVTFESFSLPKGILNISWSPSGEYLAVGTSDDVIYFLSAKLEMVSKFESGCEANELAWDHSETLFYIATGKGSVTILNWPSLELKETISAHPSNCYCLKMDTSGRFYATGAADALVSVWNAQENICVASFGDLDVPVRAVSLNFDSTLVAFGSEDSSIQVVNIFSRETTKLDVSTPTNALAWHPSQNLLAIACDADSRRHPKGILRVFGTF